MQRRVALLFFPFFREKGGRASKLDCSILFAIRSAQFILIEMSRAACNVSLSDYPTVLYPNESRIVYNDCMCFIPPVRIVKGSDKHKMSALGCGDSLQAMCVDRHDLMTQRRHGRLPVTIFCIAGTTDYRCQWKERHWKKTLTRLLIYSG